MASVFNTYKKKNVTTKDTVLTVPLNTVMTVIGLTVANTSGSDSSVSVYLDDTYILKGATLGAGSSIVPIGGEQKVVVPASSRIDVESTGTVDVVCSVLEQN